MEGFSPARASSLCGFSPTGFRPPIPYVAFVVTGALAPGDWWTVVFVSIFVVCSFCAYFAVDLLLFVSTGPRILSEAPPSAPSLRARVLVDVHQIGDALVLWFKIGVSLPSFAAGAPDLAFPFGPVAATFHAPVDPLFSTTSSTLSAAPGTSKFLLYVPHLRLFLVAGVLHRSCAAHSLGHKDYLVVVGVLWTLRPFRPIPCGCLQPNISMFVSLFFFPVNLGCNWGMLAFVGWSPVGSSLSPVGGGDELYWFVWVSGVWMVVPVISLLVNFALLEGYICNLPLCTLYPP